MVILNYFQYFTVGKVHKRPEVSITDPCLSQSLSTPESKFKLLKAEFRKAAQDNLCHRRKKMLETVKVKIEIVVISFFSLGHLPPPPPEPCSFVGNYISRQVESGSYHAVRPSVHPFIHPSILFFHAFQRMLQLTPRNLCFTPEPM